MSGERPRDAANDETVVGVLSCSAKLARGIEQITLFLTSRRLIVNHRGKRGSGLIATAPYLGRLGEDFEDRVRTGKESFKMGKPGVISPDKVLGAHKDNFQVFYTEIVDVEVAGDLNSATITLLTNDDKFVFSTQSGLGPVHNLLRTLIGQKVRSVQSFRPV